VVSLAEIRFGIELVSNATQRADLHDWLTNTIRPMFAQRVLPITEEIMLKWRLLVEEGRKTGLSAQARCPMANLKSAEANRVIWSLTNYADIPQSRAGPALFRE
jgi:hypothetical protein